MTLDEAIIHAEEVAQGQSELYDCYLQHGEQGEYVESCKKCASDHRQLAGWLKDYKRLKEQDPCEDAISRQAVIDAMFGLCDDGENPHIDAITDTIERIAPITPQPKMGHWIMSDDGLYRPICNNCGAHPWKGYIPTVEEATEVFKYCPNCGAKMEVEDEESN